MRLASFAAAAVLTLNATPALAEAHHDAHPHHGEASGPVFTPSELPYPFSEAVQVGDVLYLSGQIGVAQDGVSLVPGGIEPETRAMMDLIEASLTKHGIGWSDVFKCTVFLADMAEWPAFNAIYATYFEEGRYPARSAMGVNGLALGAAVEMECLAYRPQ